MISSYALRISWLDVFSNLKHPSYLKIAKYYGKALYLFIGIKLVLTWPLFFDQFQPWNGMVNLPISLKNVLINLFYVDTVSTHIIPITILVLVILGIAIISPPNLVCSLVVFWINCNLFKITELYTDGADFVLNFLLFANIFISGFLYKPRNALIAQAGIVFTKIQLAFIYLVSGLDKFNTEGWMNGQYVKLVLNLDFIAHPMFNNFSIESEVILKMISWMVIFFELAFPLLIWIKETRIYIIFMGIVIHIFISIFLSLPDFGLIMLIPYLLFINDTRLESAAKWIKTNGKLKRNAME